ncbi:MAG: hypothetical protein CMA07_00735 [Euryarchaeota archaeon]|nr:hypothetical protein [Euryarchaeota archaeon]
MAQGYTPEQAKGFTQQHFPGFSPAAAMPAPMPAPMPAAPQPMVVPMAGAPQMGMPMGAPMGGMMPAPQMAMQPSSGSSPIGYIAVVCVVITLALSTWGVLGGSWLVPDDDDADDIDARLTLSDTVIQSTVDDLFGIEDCDELFDLVSKSELEDGFGEITCEGDEITITFSHSERCDDWDSDDGDDEDEEEACDVATAGLTGTIILWVAIGVGLIATLLISFNVFNIQAIPVDTQKFGMIAGISSGVLVAVAVALWMIMMPDLDDAAYGLNVWLTFAAAATGIAGGILVKTHGNASA